MKLMFPLLMSVALTAPLAAETPQKSDAFVRNIQHELNLFGFKHVDAAELTNQQLGALHLKLSNSVSPFGLAAIQRKQEIKVILGWTQ